MRSDMADQPLSPPFQLAVDLAAMTRGRAITVAERGLMGWLIGLMFDELRVAEPEMPPDDQPIFPDPDIAEMDELRHYLLGGR